MARKKGWTDETIAKLRTPAKGREDHWDHGEGYVTGLGLRIGQGKKRPWIIAYRPTKDAPRQRITIGDFAAGMTLDQARTTAKEWLQIAKDGTDPRVADKAKRDRARLEEQREQQNNVRVVAERFRKEYLSQRRSGEAVWKEFERTLLKEHGGRPITEITKGHLVAMRNAVHEHNGGYAANRLTAHLKRFFGWAVEQDILDASPADHLTMSFVNEQKRDRVLDEREIRALWKATEPRSAFNSAVRFLLATATRRDETRKGRQQEIDPEQALWTIPGDRSKNIRAHTLPLSPLALRILADAPKPETNTEYLFTTGGWAPISMGKPKRQLDAAMLAALREAAKERGEDPAKVELRPWRLHDLRRTAASGMAMCGVKPHVIERALNHKSGEIRGVGAVYNRYDYLSEMRQALDAWADRIEQVAAGRKMPHLALVAAG